MKQKLHRLSPKNRGKFEKFVDILLYVKKNAPQISAFVGLITYPISVLLDKVGIWGIITCAFFAGFLLTKKPEKRAHWIGERHN